MKNKHQEWLIASAKRNKRTRKYGSMWDHERKIFVYHVYDGSRTKGYWDDTAFVHGSQIVYVFWTHPRYEYYERCSDLAYEAIIKPNSEPQDLFAGSTPVYKKLGKNKKRKRIVLWRCQPPAAESMDKYKRWDELAKQYASTGVIEQRATFKITQLNSGKAIDICCPLEVVDVHSLNQLAHFAKECMIDRTLFDATYSDYVYTAEDWLREQEEHASE